MDTLTSVDPVVDRVLTGKYLTVVLAEEAYGINVLKIREIIRLQKVTPVPRLPEHVKGVINLRGRVIPIMDLRSRFGLQDESAARTCIVVVEVEGFRRTAPLMGLIVDAVEEVVSLTEAEIEPIPQFGPAVDTSFLLGMAKVKGNVKALLDIDRVIASESLCTLATEAIDEPTAASMNTLRRTLR